MKEIKNGEVVEETLEEVIDVDELEEKTEESKLKTLGLKAKRVLKTHGKKIAVGAIFGVGMLVGVAIGHKGNDEDDDIYSDDDIIDAVTFTEVNVDDSTDDESEEETENEE